MTLKEYADTVCDKSISTLPNEFNAVMQKPFDELEAQKKGLNYLAEKAYHFILSKGGDGVDVASTLFGLGYQYAALVNTKNANPTNADKPTSLADQLNQYFDRLKNNQIGVIELSRQLWEAGISEHIAETYESLKDEIGDVKEIDQTATLKALLQTGFRLGFVFAETRGK